MNQSAGWARRMVARVAGAPVTGTEIATDAERYIGLGYVFGGDASTPGVWDCSSFVSYVLGHDLGLGIPGGRFGEPGFPPTAHGPVVTSYASWAGAVTVTTPAVGDLACFVGVGASGHIGIVVGPNLMVSALDTSQGTVKTPIIGYGPAGAPLIYRRILGIPAGAGIVGPGGMGALGGGVSPVMLLTLLVVAGMIGALIVGAALIGTGIMAGGGYFAYKVIT